MKKVLNCILAMTIFTFPILSQSISPKVDAAEKKLIIDSIAVKLKRSYIFEDVAVKMNDLIIKNHNEGVYNTVDDPMEFSRILTRDLRSVCKDGHLAVFYGPDMIKSQRNKRKGDTNAVNDELRKLRNTNYDFKEIKILPGNVGYLKFNGFGETQEAMQTAIGAMNFLANTDALIIDLRDNGGGSATMIQLICSYFFGDEPVHLNTFYTRETNKTEQTWTLPYVPGRKLLNTDIYVLTSSFTFSAAEEFTYNLKNLKRATVIGETTGGGAHPVKFEEMNDNFMLKIPFGRAINPITNTNWEGTGIEPHIKTSRAAAFDSAYQTALCKLMEKQIDDRFKAIYQWTLDGIKAKSASVTLDNKTMKLYAGNYGPRRIIFENGFLYYQRENGPKRKLIPMATDYFMLEDVDFFRLKVLTANGKITGIEGHYDDGRTDSSPRSE